MEINKVLLKYYKDNGNYYSEGSYNTVSSLYTLSAEIKKKVKNMELPDLSLGTWDGYIYFEVKNDMYQTSGILDCSKVFNKYE